MAKVTQSQSAPATKAPQQAKNVPAQPAKKPAVTQVAPAGDEDKKVVKKPFDLIGSKDPNVYPFKVRQVEVDGVKVDVGTPEGFDHASHEQMGRDDFDTARGYALYRADLAKTKVDFWLNKANGTAKLSETKKAKTIELARKQAKRMQELRKTLEAQGMNVDELLKEEEAA
jgi:hypothetical protein